MEKINVGDFWIYKSDIENQDFFLESREQCVAAQVKEIQPKRPFKKKIPMKRKVIDAEGNVFEYRCMPPGKMYWIYRCSFGFIRDKYKM